MHCRVFTKARGPDRVPVVSCKDEGPVNPLGMWDYVLEEEPPQGLSVRDIRKLHCDPVKVTIAIGSRMACHPRNLGKNHDKAYPAGEENY